MASACKSSAQGKSLASLIDSSLQAMALLMPLEMKAFTGSSMSLAVAAGLFFGRVLTLLQIFGHCCEER